MKCIVKSLVILSLAPCSHCVRSASGGDIALVEERSGSTMKESSEVMMRLLAQEKRHLAERVAEVSKREKEISEELKEIAQAKKRISRQMEELELVEQDAGITVKQWKALKQQRKRASKQPPSSYMQRTSKVYAKKLNSCLAICSEKNSSKKMTRCASKCQQMYAV